MAVQAQYQSNVLFLNGSVQEGKSRIGNNNSLQPQLGGGLGDLYLDKTQMLFNPGVGANSRRRGREHTTSNTTAAMNPLMPMQSQPQLIDLTQLYTLPQQQQQQPNIISTGLRLAFEDQSHQQQQQQRQQHYASPQFSQSSILLKEDLTSHFKQQQDEIEHFLRVQGEQLRRTLEEKRERHYHALLGATEETIARRLREKDTEVEKAARRNAELEVRVAQLTAEARAWQAKAHEQEVTAATLQAQLQQVAMMKGGINLQERDDGCGISCGGEAEDAESAYVDPDRVVESTGPSCKACRNRFASVVLLPCRHLCLCTECDAVAQSCPLCRSIKSSSVEFFLR